MRAVRPLLFRIFYSTSFTIVFLLVLAFIISTPADAVYQAWKDKRQWDIVVIAGTYILTALIAILIYASRLYTNRSILQAIPKTYIPIEKDDLPGKLTRKEIVQGLERSAIVAYKARPRFERTEDNSPTASARISAITQSNPKKDGYHPTWDHITHPGWSSPASPDLPNLHYDTVIAELPNLIEAKAVSLAPVSPRLISHPDDMPLPDERVVEILQRPINVGLRDYIAYLDSLGLINPPTLGSEFLSLYERARFSTKPLNEPEFRTLMSIFASILRGMTKLNPDLLAELLDLDIDQTAKPEWQTAVTGSLKSASTFSVNDTGSTHHHHPHEQLPPRRVSEDSVPSQETEDDDAQSLRTAPLSQSRNRNRASFASTIPESQSRTRNQNHTNPRSRPPTSSRVASATSKHSLRPTRSNISIASSGSSGQSGGSVIRLREARSPLDLPYTIEIPDVNESWSRRTD